MANASLFMDIIARDSASAVFNKVGTNAASMGKGVDKAAKNYGAFGRAVKYAFGMVSMYSIGRFIGQSVKEYAAAELAQNKLENAYKRFPKLANTNIQSLRDLNTAMMQKTRFDDDAAAAMQANLARFDLTGKQILKLTPLVMDLAEATGTDLVTAGGQLGKAFLGNTRALKQLGIDYELTGNRAKDTANIIDLVNKKVGGEATRAGKTTAVQLEILKNQYGELKETVGKALIPAFSKLMDVAGPAVKKLGDAIDRNMPQIEQTFSDAWEAASKFGGALKGIWDGFSSMPEGVRNVLLALAGGTWAFGKIKGSALGTGISSLFSGIKTITAGNVTVIGKSVTGTPGTGPGTTKGPGILTAVGGPVGIAAIITAVATAYNVKKHTEDFRNPVPTPAPGGNFPGLGNGQTRFESTGNWISDKQQRAMSAWAARYQGQVNGVRDAVNRVGRASTDWGKAAQAAGIKGTLGATAFGKSLNGIPKKKTTKVDVDGADNAKGKVKGLGGAIGGLRGKRVKVDEDGANASRTRVRNLEGSIRGLRGKTVNVGVNGAENARTQVYNLVSAINSLHDKTVTTYYREVKASQVKNAATGGLIVGPGSGTSDSIPTWLSNGEFVIRAAAVQRYGTGLFHKLNALRFAKGGKVKKETRKEIKQARAEAARQRRIANQAEGRGLSDEVLSFLGGMSSQAALKALATMKNSKLAKAARQATAVSRLQERRQAAKDAQQQAAEDAAAAAEEAARAAEEAAQRERDAQASVRDAIEQTAASYRSFASIATTTTGDVSEAQDKLTAAQDKVAEARKKFDLAGNDRDRAEAARELAAAEAEATAAQQARNNVSDKVTSGSIQSNMAGKLTRLREFAAAVKQLKANGLNATTLADILAMGPDQGYDYAKALLDGGIGDINAIQSQITAEAASLGLFTAGVNSASTTAVGQANAAAAGLDINLVPAPVTLNLDGYAIAQALLAYQRQSGG